MKSIREIAKLSGVSTATVSRYNNKSGYISKEAAEKIKAVIDEHGYTPNDLVTSIIKKNSTTIGVIVQDILNPFFPEIICEIEKQANKYGYRIILCNAVNNYDLEEAHYNYLLSHRVRAMIVVNTSNEIIYANCPIPLVGIEKKIGTFPYVTSDNYNGASEGALHLIKNGATNILFISSDETNYISNLRKSGFLKVVKDNNIDYNVIGSNQEEINITDIKGYDAIFCWNDLVAHQIYKLLYNNKINVPNQVQLLGFDNLDINKLFAYNLSTINQDISGLGICCIELVIKEINGTNNYKDEVVLPITFLNGNTTK